MLVDGQTQLLALNQATRCPCQGCAEVSRCSFPLEVNLLDLLHVQQQHCQMLCFHVHGNVFVFVSTLFQSDGCTHWCFGSRSAVPLHFWSWHCFALAAATGCKNRKTFIATLSFLSVFLELFLGPSRTKKTSAAFCLPLINFHQHFCFYSVTERIHTHVFIESWFFFFGRDSDLAFFKTSTQSMSCSLPHDKYSPCSVLLKSLGCSFQSILYSILF